MSDRPASQRGALLALLATILLWAYSWVVMKQALAFAGPFDFAAMRYLLGAAVLFAALALARRPLKPPPLLAYTMPFWAVLLGLCAVSGVRLRR